LVNGWRDWLVLSFEHNDRVEGTVVNYC